MRDKQNDLSNNNILTFWGTFCKITRSRSDSSITFTCVLIFFGMLEFCFFLSGALFILLAYGPDAIDFAQINPSIQNFPYRLQPTIFNHIAEVWNNPQEYPSELKLKLTFAFVLPITILLIVLWSVRKKIIKLILSEWRSFKRKVSLDIDLKSILEKNVRIELRKKSGLYPEKHTPKILSCKEKR